MKFRVDLQERTAFYIGVISGSIFLMILLFVMAYPSNYPMTVLGQLGLLPAASWVSYYLTFKLYQKNSLLQYFAVCFCLILVGCLSCYMAFLMSGLSSENFVWAVVALVLTGSVFAYCISLCLVVKMVKFVRHRK